MVSIDSAVSSIVWLILDAPVQASASHKTVFLSSTSFEKWTTGFKGVGKIQNARLSIAFIYCSATSCSLLRSIDCVGIPFCCEESVFPRHFYCHLVQVSLGSLD